MLTKTIRILFLIDSQADLKCGIHWSAWYCSENGFWKRTQKKN